VAQLLRTYQLWLDDLYPRAKFADGLAIIEKLGHSKRMQITRRTWIDESKPKASIEEGDAEHEPLPATSDPGSQPNATGAKPLSAEASRRPSTGINELDTISQARTSGAGPSDGSPVIDLGAPDDDELDALLAEDPDINLSQNGNSNEMPPSQGSHRPNSKTEQRFEDDEEALREMDMW
jgi:replication fork protection complex subunit Csm3/Swi3